MTAYKGKRATVAVWLELAGSIEWANDAAHPMVGTVIRRIHANAHGMEGHQVAHISFKPEEWAMIEATISGSAMEDEFE